MGNLNSTTDWLNSLQPSQVVKEEKVKSRFIQIYDTLWGDGDAAYERESIFFNHWILDNAKVAGSVTRLSIFSAFLDLAISGLSIEGGTQALCYLQPRSYQAGVDASGKRIYESRLTLTISGYGELVMRTRAGQIKYADNPVIVYEGDTFEFNDKNGVKKINYTRKIPRQQDATIIACYIRIVRNDNSIDYSVMFPEDWERLSRYSSRQNGFSGKANELYTSNNGQIDTGFLMAKCIKHAFKTYPKLRTGKATELQTDLPEPQYDCVPGMDNPYDIPYDIPEQSVPQNQAPFVPEPEPAGVVVEPTEDDGPF